MQAPHPDPHAKVLHTYTHKHTKTHTLARAPHDLTQTHSPKSLTHTHTHRAKAHYETELQPETAKKRELEQRAHDPARSRRPQASPRGRSSVYKSMTTSPRVVSKRTAMAPASSQEDTPGIDRRMRSLRASTPYVTICATALASPAGTVAHLGGAISGRLVGRPFGPSRGIRCLLSSGSGGCLKTPLRAWWPV